MTKLLKFAVAVLFTCVQIATAAPALPAAEPAAAVKPPGAIAGRVTDDSGNPIAGAAAEAFACSDETPSGSAATDKNGEYLMKGMADGCYRLRFSGNDLESSWHGGKQIKDDAADVRVSGEKVQGIDAKLSEAGSVISGTVTGADGAPLSGAWVTVLQTGGIGEEDGGSISDGRTDEKGSFSVRIYPGKCLVVFAKKGYVTRLHGKSAVEPTMVEAAKGKTVSGVNGVLSKGGSISGSITDDRAKPLAGVYVVAYPTERTALPAYARSDAGGKFALEGLATGKYRIAFGDREQKYLLQWHDGKTNPEEAAIIAVTAPGAISGIKGVMRQSGGISGMVTDQNGKAIAEVIVIAEPLERKARGGSAVTDETGSYSIPGLDSASYHLSFRATSSDHLPLYYRDAARKEDAKAVEVTASQTVFGVNQVLQEGVLLTGKVSNTSGEPVQQATVSIYPAKEVDGIPEFASTQPDGGFSAALGEGEYVVEVRAPGYLTQWAGKAATRAEAAAVSVSKKEGVQPLEIVLDRGASISGTVKDRTGAGIARVTVTARDAATGDRGESTTSGEGGKYQIQGLKSGSYRLEADGTDLGYVEAKLPQPVMVTAPGTTENVNLVLSQGGAVSGKVTDPAGAALSMVSVAAYDPATWDEVGSAYSGISGEYNIGGLPEGSYAIRFEKSDSKYPVQWHKGKFRREESARVEVAGTSTVAGVDAALQPGVSLTGTVTDTGGSPLANAKIEVYGGNDDEPFADTRTDLRGNFTVSSLAPGSYRVLFSHKGHVSGWYGGSDRRNAARLAIKDAAVAPLSAALAPARGEFSGKLVNPEGKKIGQAWLTAIDALTGVAVTDERICECSGEFHTPVPGGMYQLRVERHGQVTWYGGSVQEEALQLPGTGEISGLEMVIDDKGVRGKLPQRN